MNGTDPVLQAFTEILEKYEGDTRCLLRDLEHIRAAKDTEEEQRRHAFGLRWKILFTLVVLLVLGVALDDIAEAPQGRKFLLRTDAAIRSSLILVPSALRCVRWHFVRDVADTLLQGAVLHLGHGGNIQAFMRDLHYQNGDVTPYQHTVACHRFSHLEMMQESAYAYVQDDGQFSCLTNPDDITSSGLRSLIARALHRRHTITNDTLGTVGDPVQPALLRRVWHQVFGEIPAQSTLVDLEAFLALGEEETEWYRGGGFLPNVPCWRAPFGQLSHLEAIRDRAVGAARRTQVGKEFIHEAMGQLAMSKVGAEKALRQLVEIFLKRVVTVTMVLGGKVLERLRSEPSSMLPLWHRDHFNFLLETTRLDIPLQPTVVRLGKGVELDVASGFVGSGQIALELHRGDEVILAPNTIMIDPAVFGGPSKSRKRAESFDPERPEMKILVNAHKAVQETLLKHGQPPSFGILPVLEVLDALLPPQSNVTCPSTQGGHPDGLHIVDAQEKKMMQAYVAMAIVLLVVFLSTGYMLFDHRCFLFSRAYTIMLVGAVGSYGALLLAQPFLMNLSLCITTIGIWRCNLICRAFRKDPDFFVKSKDGSQKIATPGAAGLQIYGIGGCAFMVLVYYLAGEQDGNTSGLTKHAPQTEIQGKLYPALPLLFTLLVLIYFPTWFWSLFQFAYHEPQWKRRRKMWACIVLATCRIFSYILMEDLTRWMTYAGWASNKTPVYVIQFCLVLLAVFSAAVAALAIDERLKLGDPGKHRQLPDEQHDKQSCFKKRSWKLLQTTYFALFVLVAGALLFPYINVVLRGGKLCYNGEELLADHVEICSLGKRLLEQADPATVSFFKLAKTLLPIGPHAGPIPNGSAVVVPTEMRTLPKLSVLDAGSLEVPIFDEDYGTENMAAPIVFTWLRNPMVNPLEDKHSTWDSDEQGIEVMLAADGGFLSALRLSDWKEMRSDEALTRWAVSGLAAHNLRPAPFDIHQPSGLPLSYVNDFAWLSSFAVRPGFERYGATAYFGPEMQPLLIWLPEQKVNVSVGESQWEHAKWVFRCSALVGVTLKDHLMGVHYIASNSLATAAFENLNSTHPLRRMLRPHTCGANAVNMAARRALSAEYALVHRATALTREAFNEACAAGLLIADIFGQHNFTSNGMAKMVADRPELFPYAEDALEFRGVIHRFVSAYVQVYYPNDEALRSDPQLHDFWEALHFNMPEKAPQLTGRAHLIEILSFFIDAVTGMHNHVGNIGDYFRSPTFVSSKIRQGTQQADVQAAFQGLNIALLTAMATPKLLNNFEHLLLPDQHHANTTAIFRSFQRELEELADTIEQKNINRTFPCNSYNPHTMLSSVSV